MGKCVHICLYFNKNFKKLKAAAPLMGRPGSDLALLAAVADLGSLAASRAFLHSNLFDTHRAKGDGAADAKLFIGCLEELHGALEVGGRIHVDPCVDQMLQLIDANRFSWLNRFFYLLEYNDHFLASIFDQIDI